MKAIKRATQEKLLSRRRDMLQYNQLGLKVVDWIPKIVEKYDCSKDAIKKDWAERKRWMQSYLKLRDVENTAVDFLLDFEISLIDARKLYDEAKDVKTKIQTLWLRFKAIQMKMDFLRDLGALEKIKTEYSLENSQYRNKRHNEVYPETERQKREREIIESIPIF